MENYESEYDHILHNLKDKLMILKVDNTNCNKNHNFITSNPLIPVCMDKKVSLLSRNKRAAVLICIFRGQNGELRVILTRRSMNLSSHPGDVALPGGKMDEGDVDDSATALRESMEEIGLDPNLVHVVANLEPFISSNLLTVVPVIGLLSNVENFKPVLNVDEVDAIFDAPLAMFLEV